jgi:CheY-like chemotaxis protein
MNGSHQPWILLADDDGWVAELIVRRLAAAIPTVRIIEVRDGAEALACLHSAEPFTQRPAGNPAVVLLDLKMPRVDGLEVLRRIREDPRLRPTPVVMLTSSEDERDVRASYDAGANAYVVKPVGCREFQSVIEGVGNFWTRINLPPP